jgi:hypothetical protein
MEENIIQIMVHEKTKELAVCSGSSGKTCRKVRLGKELLQKELDGYIMAIELDLDRL